MSGLTKSKLTEISTTHHGPTRHDRYSRAMDIDLRASRGHASTKDPSVTNPPMNPDLSAENSAPSSSTTQQSNHDSSSSIPVITLSSVAQDDEPKFNAPLRLCHTEYAPSSPHPSQDLLSLYGLSPLVATVARVDPTTGKKINKLRRSYEGQVKNFGLAGRNKAMKHEESPTSMGLVEMSAWPDEEWHNQKVSGKELSKGLSGGALSKLEKALKLEPGPVPKNDEWENILGHETRKGPAIEGKAKQPIQPTIKAPKVNGQMNGVATAAVSEKGVARPQRAKKRTRYDDASFEGYGEGFVDDDRDDDDGYTSNEGSKRSSGSRKKRRKSGTYNNVATTSVPDRVSYAGGGMMQHVGRGIGAYGGR